MNQSDEDSVSNKSPGKEEPDTTININSDNDESKPGKENIPTLDEPVKEAEGDSAKDIIDIPILTDQLEKKTD